MLLRLHAGDMKQVHAWLRRHNFPSRVQCISKNSENYRRDTYTCMYIRLPLGGDGIKDMDSFFDVDVCRGVGFVGDVNVSMTSHPVLQLLDDLLSRMGIALKDMQLT